MAWELVKNVPIDNCLTVIIIIIIIINVTFSLPFMVNKDVYNV